MCQPILPDCSLVVIQGRCEADAAPLRGWWIHELADCRENGGDGLIVVRKFPVEAGFKLREATSELLGSKPVTRATAQMHAQRERPLPSQAVNSGCSRPEVHRAR